MIRGRVMAVAMHMVRANTRMGLTRAGFLVFPLIALLGPLGSWTGGDGWALDQELFFYGFLVGALFVIRSGLGEQREGDMDTFLRLNFVSPLEHAAAVLLSLVSTWLGFCGLAFLVGMAVSADPPAAAWITVSLTARSGLLIAVVPFVEAATRLRAPLILPVLGFLALMLGLSVTVGEGTMLRLLGSAGQQGDPASFFPVAARSAAGLGLGSLAFLAGSARRSWTPPGR
jgi:hypothetical protein